MKKIWKSTTLILGLGLLGSVIGTSLPSCSNHTPESNYVGNDDGTNWKGHILGWLDLEFNDSNDTCGIISSSSFYYAENLIIPNKISHENRIYTLVSIGDWVFGNFTTKSLYGSLTIPDSVTTIGTEAFYECSRLTGTLNIPDSVTTIGEYAFWGCQKLTGLTIGSAVTSIGYEAFYECSGLTGTLTIPDSVTVIGGWAFAGCQKLTGGLIIGSAVTSIGEGAFGGCNFNEVVNYSDSFVLINSTGITDKLSKTNSGFMLVASDIPEETDADMNIQNVVFACGDNITIPSSISGHNVISIGDPNRPDLDSDYTAFGWSNIKTLESDSVNKIYGRSFYNCHYLTKVNFPEVKEIHESAFEDAKDLREILIPKIEVISAEAFESDDSINYVEIDASRDPETQGMEIGQIFGELNNSTDGKLHNTSSESSYKEQWLNKLCGDDNHHGWKWDN